MLKHLRAGAILPAMSAPFSASISFGIGSSGKLFRVAFLLGCAALLAGCTRQTDTFQPRIMITTPEGGAVTSAGDLYIKGYVLDDTKPVQLTVNGASVPFAAGSEKIKFFSYHPKAGGENTFELQARDQAGNVSSMTLKVNVDAEPPKLHVNSFEKFGKTLRVTGTATDNERVEEILIDGRRINITKGKKVTFYAETQGVWADLTVKDRAGNEVQRRVQ